MLSAESEASLLYSAKHVLPARAKLNLSLSVLGRRADGYHDLQSVMVTLALTDEVRILTAQFDHSTQRDEIADGSQKSTRAALDSMTGFDADAERSFSGEATALDWRVSTNQPTIPFYSRPSQLE
jgi:4-diphosphocytidyl-2C-methyl-D-erythritol kinase